MKILALGGVGAAGPVDRFDEISLGTIFRFVFVGGVLFCRFLRFAALIGISLGLIRVAVFVAFVFATLVAVVVAVTTAVATTVTIAVSTVTAAVLF